MEKRQFHLLKCFKLGTTTVVGLVFAFLSSGCTLDLDISSQEKIQAEIGWEAPIGRTDTSFGDQGFVLPKVTINADLSDRYFNVVEDPSGKLYMVGYVGNEFAVRSMNANGTPNMIFGEQGISRPPSPSIKSARLLLGTQGIGTYIYVTTLSGSDAVGGTIRLLRMDLEGKVYTTVEIPDPQVREVVDMVWALDGSYFLVLHDADGMRVMKIDKDGNTDLAWGNSGSWFGDDADAVFNYGVFYRGLRQTADGKLYVLLESTGGSQILYSLDAQGVLDTTFRGTGFLKIPKGTTSLSGFLVDQSGRFVIYGANGDEAYVARYTSAGDLDTSFNAPDGFLTFNEPSARSAFQFGLEEGDGSYRIYGYVDQGDPLLQVSGYALGQEKKSFARWSLSTAGVVNLETDLASSTKLDPLDEVKSGGSSGGYYVHQPAIMRSSSGQILYLSNSWSETLLSGVSFAESHLFRLRDDGSQSWATSKVFTQKLDFEVSLVTEAVVPGPNESLYYISGYDLGRDRSATAIYHLKGDGTFDNAFGSGGVVTIQDSSLNGAALDNDGRLVLSLSVYDLATSSEKMELMRLLPSGIWDASFGTSGKARLALSADGWDRLDNMAPTFTDDGGVIVPVLAYDEGLDVTTQYLWKVNNNGQTQSSWGVSGLVTLSGPSLDYIEVLRKKGEWLYLTASVDETTGSVTNEYSIMARLNLLTGQLDGSFGNLDSHWKKYGSAPGAPLFVASTALEAMDSSHRIYLVSELHSENDNSVQYRIDRYSLDGQLDLSFRDGQGYVVNALEVDDSFEIGHLLVQQDDTVLMVETHYYETDQVYNFSILRALDTSGQVNLEFGDQGEISSLDIQSGFSDERTYIGGVYLFSSNRVILNVINGTAAKLMALE